MDDSFSCPCESKRPRTHVAIHAEDGIVERIDRIDEIGTVENYDCCGNPQPFMLTMTTPIYEKPAANPPSA